MLNMYNRHLYVYKQRLERAINNGDENELKALFVPKNPRPKDVDVYYESLCRGDHDKVFLNNKFLNIK